MVLPSASRVVSVRSTCALPKIPRCPGLGQPRSRASLRLPALSKHADPTSGRISNHLVHSGPDSEPCDTARVTPPDPHLHSWATGLLDDLTVARGRGDRLTHLELLAPRAARFAAWPEWTPPAVRDAFAERGVEQPWSHQVEAAEAAWAGEHVVVSTGTASGKSLAFQLPALAAAEAARGERGQRGATVLYVAPTKA